MTYKDLVLSQTTDITSKISGTRKFSLRYQYFQQNFYIDILRMTVISSHWLSNRHLVVAFVSQTWSFAIVFFFTMFVDSPRYLYV